MKVGRVNHLNKYGNGVIKKTPKMQPIKHINNTLPSDKIAKYRKNFLYSNTYDLSDTRIIFKLGCLFGIFY